jgi:hypothetical protein
MANETNFQDWLKALSVEMTRWQWTVDGIDIATTYAKQWEAMPKLQAQHKTAVDYVLFRKGIEQDYNLATLKAFSEQVGAHAIDLTKFTNAMPWRLKVFNRMTGFNIKLTTKAMQDAAKNWNL